MPVSGLLLTLNADQQLAAHTMAALSARAEFMVGEQTGRWLPVAVEAADETQSQQLHDWLTTLPGVEFVDVVSVHFTEETAEPTRNRSDL